jgi:hypothetical protein
MSHKGDYEMKSNIMSTAISAGVAIIMSLSASVGLATEPCGDFGECKVLIEINSSDGDVGFHFLMDGDDLNSARIRDPDGTKVFEDMAKGPLREQKLTETFAESAEPLCWYDPVALAEDPDEEIVTLQEFLERWTPGSYTVEGSGDGGEKSQGETELLFELPAAPQDVDFDGSVISWTMGDDLGNCAEAVDTGDAIPDLADVADTVTLIDDQEDIDAWEVVLEPEVDDDDSRSGLKFSIRLPNTENSVTVPADYLASLGPDTPVKIEVGAIAAEDNATFTEADGFCVNEDEGCD